MKQTAVQWLIEVMGDDIPQFMQVEALNMEKEQIFDFVRTMPKRGGITQEGEPYVQYDVKKHYNETYGQESTEENTN